MSNIPSVFMEQSRQTFYPDFLFGNNNKPNIGNQRETFFMSQMKVNYNVLAAEKSDFQIGEYTFEIGGQSPPLLFRVPPSTLSGSVPVSDHHT